MQYLLCVTRCKWFGNEVALECGKCGSSDIRKRLPYEHVCPRMALTRKNYVSLLFLSQLFRQTGTAGEDSFNAAALTHNNSVVLAGYTYGNWNGNVGGGDFAAVKLDSEGNELWRWQVRYGHFLC